MRTIRKVLVVGGGIGGLSTAIGLRRVGIDVDVIEIRKEWAVHHVGIIVQGNFIRAMVALGIADKCVAAGFPFDEWRFYDAQWNLLSTASGTKLAGSGYPSNLGLTRPALHEVLSETAGELGSKLRLGLTLSQIGQSNEKVSVQFTDGTSGDYDFVVGADGIYSKVRSILFGDKYKPQFTGQGTWRCRIPRPKSLDYLILCASERNGKAGAVPLTPDTAYVFKVDAEAGNARFADNQLHELLRQRLAAFGGLIGEIRDRDITDPAEVVYRPLEALILPPPWHRGRVLLIGDAAHSTTPHLGQGAAQAVEDAVVLSELLAKDAPVAELIDEFMRRRYERSKFIVEASVQIGEWEQHPTPDADFIGLTRKMMEVVAAPI
jgi:2-polyprenyl-6-methoxyphenol hydroxylase-like FAD-dependent oxidoreductase